MAIIVNIMDFYEYIASIVCPFMLKHLQDVDDVYDTDDSIEPKSVRFQVPGLDSDHSDGNIENTNNYTEQPMENRDGQSDNVNINRYPFKRIHSYSINHYYCGYCSQLINSPEFMYQDEPYCNIRCRNHRIVSDGKNKVREHHSFSA